MSLYPLVPSCHCQGRQWPHQRTSEASFWRQGWLACKPRVHSRWLRACRQPVDWVWTYSWRTQLDAQDCMTRECCSWAWALRSGARLRLNQQSDDRTPCCCSACRGSFVDYSLRCWMISANHYPLQGWHWLWTPACDSSYWRSSILKMREPCLCLGFQNQRLSWQHCYCPQWYRSCLVATVDSMTYLSLVNARREDRFRWGQCTWHTRRWGWSCLRTQSSKACWRSLMTKAAGRCSCDPLKTKSSYLESLKALAGSF